jgi:NADH-quinone oxidoreductase subunit J
VTAALGAPVLATAMVDNVVFAICAAIVLVGALGVVLWRNPVYSALSLVLTLFGVAVLFVEEDAQFLAAVQVIVYAGAIVVLFLFVIMLLGVDQAENLEVEPLVGQRPAAIGLGLAGLACLLLPIAFGKWEWLSGAPSVVGPARSTAEPNVNLLAKALFTRYLLPFEATSVLLVIAVIGAVVLARRPLSSERERQTVREEP